jgi:hypothetical protein
VDVTRRAKMITKKPFLCMNLDNRNVEAFSQSHEAIKDPNRTSLSNDAERNEKTKLGDF